MEACRGRHGPGLVHVRGLISSGRGGGVSGLQPDGDSSQPGVRVCQGGQSCMALPCLRPSGGGGMVFCFGNRWPLAHLSAVQGGGCQGQRWRRCGRLSKLVLLHLLERFQVLLPVRQEGLHRLGGVSVHRVLGPRLPLGGVHLRLRLLLCAP